MLLLLMWITTRAVRKARRERGRGYSAATTTTATREAAQINCAALGEQKLDAG
jgi:hypothetical protein